MWFHHVRPFDESSGCNHVVFMPRRPSLKSKWVVVGRREDDDDDDDDDHHYRGVPIRWPRCCSTDDSRTLISSRLSLTHSLFLPYYLILSPFIFSSLFPSRHRQCEITNGKTNGRVQQPNCDYHFHDLLFTKLNSIGRSLEAALKPTK